MSEDLLINSKIYIYKKKADPRDEHNRLTLKEILELFKQFYQNENQTSFLFYKDGRNI